MDPYFGNDQLVVGNGAGLPFHHFDQGILPKSSFNFSLNHVLHVPSIAFNLLSIHQLANDNNCRLLFDKTSFMVHDIFVSKIVLKRPSKWTLLYSTSITVHVAFTATHKPLYHIFGHPSSQVQQHFKA